MISQTEIFGSDCRDVDPLFEECAPIVSLLFFSRKRGKRLGGRGGGGNGGSKSEPTSEVHPWEVWPPKKDVLRDMVARMFTLTMIAENYGRSPRTIKRELKRFGIKKKFRPGPQPGISRYLGRMKI